MKLTLVGNDIDSKNYMYTFCVSSVQIEKLNSSIKDLLYEIRCRFKTGRISKPESMEGTST